MRVVTFQCSRCLYHTTREEVFEYGPAYSPEMFYCSCCRKITTQAVIGSREVDDPTFDTLEDALGSDACEMSHTVYEFSKSPIEEGCMDPDIPDNFEDDTCDDDESDTWTPEAI